MLDRRWLSRHSPALLWGSSPAGLLWVLPLGAALAAVLPAGLLLGGCTDEAPEPRSGTPDASAPPCAVGTRACACTDSGGCVTGLFCNSGRCLDAEGTAPEPPDPNVRPARPPVHVPAPPLPDASTDSGSSSNG